MRYRLLIVAAALMALSAKCGGASPVVDPEKPEPVRLDAPAGVQLAGEPSWDCLEFKWNAVAGAQSYNYRLLKGNTEDKTGSTSSTSVKFEGLQEATTYKFDVAAAAGTSTSPYSKRLEVVTPKASQGRIDPEERYAAMQMPASEEDDLTRAFPGASGGGMLATGGRGGKILHVTRLDDDKNEGSLRWAVGQKYPRIIVFDVAGIISLNSRLDINTGDVTIAGQTAPGDGICIRNYQLRINASNVIVRFIRCRLGDESGEEYDALGGFSNDGQFEKIIVDHCSISWSTDECGSFYGVKDFTMQYCILSESLRSSVHSKDEHGYGGLWGGSEASYHHNLLAHHDSRNPRFSHDYLNTEKGPIHFYNNVIYNWGGNSAYGGEGYKGSDQRQINIVNNYYKPGPASRNRSRIVNPTTKCSNCNKEDQYDVVPGLFYVSGNHMCESDKVTQDNGQGVQPDDKTLLDKVRSAAYLGKEPAGLQTAENAYEAVLSHAGASRSRDSVDKRIVEETRSGKYTYEGSNGSSNGLIDSQKDVGGWPEYKATSEQLSAVRDTDKDGIPDTFEDEFGLNSADASDSQVKTIDLHGRYTNFEMYLHYLVRGTF